MKFPNRNVVVFVACIALAVFSDALLVYGIIHGCLIAPKIVLYAVVFNCNGATIGINSINIYREYLRYQDNKRIIEKFLAAPIDNSSEP